MRKMNISVPMLYKDKHGADKTKWINIGSLVINDDGKVFGEINATPIGAWDGSFNCFDKEDKQQAQQNYQQPTAQQSTQRPVTQYKNAQGQITDEYGNILPQQYQNRG